MTVGPPIDKSRRRKPRADHPYRKMSFEQMEARKQAVAAAKARRESFK